MALVVIDPDPGGALKSELEIKFTKFWPRWKAELALQHPVQSDIQINSIEGRLIDGVYRVG